jgi:hypothetical protein
MRGAVSNLSSHFIKHGSITGEALIPCVGDTDAEKNRIHIRRGKDNKDR